VAPLFFCGSLYLSWRSYYLGTLGLASSTYTENSASAARFAGHLEGDFRVVWTNPATGLSPPIKVAYLVVRQSATTVSVVMLTNESKSKSSIAVVSDDGVSASLDYMYLNRPESRYEYRSRMHHGSTSLDITGRPVIRLQGRYWTNRDSRGEIDFNQQVKKFADDFLQAEALFNG
jgi:hypothetical protein